MKKSLGYLILDGFMAIQLSAMVGIGLLMKFVLVPGQERNVLYGRGTALYVLGLDRHEWGTIHLGIGVSFLALLVLHIGLHWNRILGLLGGVSRSAAVRATILVGVLLLAIAIASFPLWVAPEVEPGKSGEDHRWGQREDRRLEPQRGTRPSGGQN